MHSHYHIWLGNLQIICVFTWSSFLCSHTFWVGSRWNGYGHFWDLAQEKLVWKISLTWVYWDAFEWLHSLPRVIVSRHPRVGILSRKALTIPLFQLLQRFSWNKNVSQATWPQTCEGGRGKTRVEMNKARNMSVETMSKHQLCKL